MKEKIEKTVRDLRMIGFYGQLAVIFISWMVIKSSGVYERVEEENFILQCTVVFSTLISIPLGLQFFKLDVVKRNIKGKKMEEALGYYLKVYMYRLALLIWPVLMIVAFSMVTPFNNTFFFCGCMSFVAFLYCFPSESHLKKELDLPEEIN